MLYDEFTQEKADLDRESYILETELNRLESEV